VPQQLPRTANSLPGCPVAVGDNPPPSKAAEPSRADGGGAGRAPPWRFPPRASCPPASLPRSLRRSCGRRGLEAEAGTVQQAGVLPLRWTQGETPRRVAARWHALLPRVPRAPGKPLCWPYCFAFQYLARSEMDGWMDGWMDA